MTAPLGAKRIVPSLNHSPGSVDNVSGDAHPESPNGVSKSRFPSRPTPAGGRRIGLDQSETRAKKGTMRKRPRRRDPEAALDRGIRSLLGKKPEDYSPDDWHSLREQLRLEILHPGQFVAFRDHFQGEGASRRLIRREVVHASRSLAAISKHVDRLPEKKRHAIYIDYVEPATARRLGP